MKIDLEKILIMKNIVYFLLLLAVCFVVVLAVLGNSFCLTFIKFFAAVWVYIALCYFVGVNWNRSYKNWRIRFWKE